MVKYKKIFHNIKRLLPDLEDVLKKEQAIVFCYIFGSYGKDKISPLSDIDIALYLKDNQNNYWEQKLNLIETITNILKTDEIDLVILNEATLSLKYFVIKTGKLLFSKNEEKKEYFIERVIDEYCDVEPLRNLEFSMLKKSYAEGVVDANR